VSLNQIHLKTLKTALIDIHHDLIEACRHNDRAAQIEIYDLYYRAMFNTSLRIVNDAAEAEDVMQDSFIEAFNKIDSYREEGSFGAWLKRIVINNSINVIRKRKEMVRIDDAQFELEDTDENEKEYSENVFCRLEEIRDSIKKLPEAYKTIISLHLLEGYDYQEISEILNTTYGNIRTRYSRAKQKLLHIIMSSRN
jgi:RNA polymerase sigma-70 factor (ECF subfamily)